MRAAAAERGPRLHSTELAPLNKLSPAEDSCSDGALHAPCSLPMHSASH